MIAELRWAGADDAVAGRWAAREERQSGEGRNPLEAQMPGRTQNDVRVYTLSVAEAKARVKRNRMML